MKEEEDRKWWYNEYDTMMVDRAVSFYYIISFHQILIIYNFKINKFLKLIVQKYYEYINILYIYNKYGKSNIKNMEKLIKNMV